LDIVVYMAMLVACMGPSMLAGRGEGGREGGEEDRRESDDVIIG